MTPEQSEAIKKAGSAKFEALAVVEQSQSDVASAEQTAREKAEQKAAADAAVTTAKSKRDAAIASIRAAEKAARALFDEVFGPLTAEPTAPPAL